MTTDKIEDTIEAWENGTLGRDAAYTKPISDKEQSEDIAAFESAFGLKPISIRMEIEALDNLKAIAKHRGIGYQPLIRQIIHRWIDCELKQIAIESMAEQSGEENTEIKVELDLKKAA